MALSASHIKSNKVIRELPRLIRHSSIICYADDITLFQRIPRNRRVQCAADLNTDLQCLLSYGASWLLVFEPTKTQVLTVSNRRDSSSNPPVVMDGVPVVESNLLKFLGYILDSKGLWSAHIDYVVNLLLSLGNMLELSGGFVIIYLLQISILLIRLVFALSWSMVTYCTGVLLRVTLLGLTESSSRLKGCLMRFLYLLWNLVELLLLWD